METITISINNEEAGLLLEEMQKKKLVTVLNTPNLNSLVFPGKPLSNKQFKSWIESRENGASMSLKEAKRKWLKKEKQLLSPER